MRRLEQLFGWACEQAELSEKTAPQRIHDYVRARHKIGSGDKKPWRGRKPTVDHHIWQGRRGGSPAPDGFRQEESEYGILGGPPFSAQFVKYLQGQKPQTPIRTALRDMKSPNLRQWDGYIICHAIIEGGYRSLDEIRSILKSPRRDVFDEMALAALDLLHTKAMERERELRQHYGLIPH